MTAIFAFSSILMRVITINKHLILLFSKKKKKLPGMYTASSLGFSPCNFSH